MSRGWLCWDGALARYAEPRLCVVVKLSGAQFYDFQCGLDGERTFPCGAARRTYIARADLRCCRSSSATSHRVPVRQRLAPQSAVSLPVHRRREKQPRSNTNRNGPSGGVAERKSNAAKRQRRSRPFILARACSTASGETSTPSTSKPRSASQIAFVPVPARHIVEAAVPGANLAPIARSASVAQRLTPAQTFLVGASSPRPGAFSGGDGHVQRSAHMKASPSINAGEMLFKNGPKFMELQGRDCVKLTDIGHRPRCGQG